MPSWDSRQYLKFEAERTRPSRDLVRRLELLAPRRAIDVGCGPGNSTAVVQERWPAAEVLGLDSSPEMLEVARRSGVPARWLLADVRRWVPEGRVDLVFSNAALQWLPEHDREIPRLFDWVAPGGALAFQVPAEGETPPGWVQALAAVHRAPRWKALLPDWPRNYNVLPLSRYYDLLAPAARALDLWDTEYQHVLDGPDATVEWVAGAGLRPVLEKLPGEAERREFLQQFAREIPAYYPVRKDGKVLFPFLRRFVIAYR